MDHAEILYSVRPRVVKYEYPLETCHSKDTHRCETRVCKPAMPSHLRLGGKERKGLMGSEEKLVTNLGGRLRGKIIGLVFEVPVRFGAD